MFPNVSDYTPKFMALPPFIVDGESSFPEGAK
jgi:hypothetical protein